MTFRCRFLVPRQSDWHDVDEPTPDLAANEFHARFVPSSADSDTASMVFVPNESKPGARVHFALIEVEGHAPVVSRVYTSGIIRQGRRPVRLTLAEIATRLGWEHPVDELLDDGWEGEMGP